jgi:isopenicillin-N epimerase
MSSRMTPGGFHSFEHRWALGAAFQFHQAIGKARIAERIHTLNRRLKEGLVEMRQVTLHTPLSDELSAGIVCFEVGQVSPEQVVARLSERGIIASVTPYATQYARLAPSLLTSPEEVDKTLAAVGELSRGRATSRFPSRPVVTTG